MELLGLAASSISIASLAIQLADSIQKLKAFCDTVKDAPNDLQLVVAEVEVLSLGLEEIVEYLKVHERAGPRTAALPPAVSKSLWLCQVSADGLRTLVRGLEQSMGERKMRGAIKIAFRKEKIERMKNRLQSAKLTLLIANQLFYQYGISLEDFVTALIKGAIWALLTVSSTAQRKDMLDLKASVSSLHSYSTPPASLVAPVPKPKFASESTTRQQICLKDSRLNNPKSRHIGKRDEKQQEIPPGFDSTDADLYEQQTDHQAAVRVKTSHSKFQKSNIILQFPVRFLSRRFELRFRRSYGGWDHSLRAYRMVPFDAPVFDFCLNGEVEKVQVLFDAELASPFDSDPDGNTPLHVRTLIIQLLNLSLTVLLDSMLYVEYGLK
jgi:hypothetical protein